MRYFPMHKSIWIIRQVVLFQFIHYLESKNERSNIDSVLQVSVNANKQVYSLLRRQNEMCEALRELMKDEIEKELENKLEQGENCN